MKPTKTRALSLASCLTAAVLLSSGVAVAQTAAPSTPDHAAMGHDPKAMGGMDMKGMDMKGMDHQGGGMGGMGGMDHSGGGMGGMGGMNHSGGGGMGGMDHAGGGMGGMGGMMRKMLCGVTEHVDGRLAYLKAELKLTDQQQAAWNAFNDAYRASIQKTAQKCAAMEAAGGEHADHSMHKGVLGHLAMMDKHMTDHLESVRGLEAAIAPLYAALTDEQKKVADEAFPRIMEVGMSMGGGH